MCKYVLFFKVKGVELGEHFYSVVLSPIKKFFAYDKSGISKEIKEYQGGGFFSNTTNLSNMKKPCLTQLANGLRKSAMMRWNSKMKQKLIQKF